MALQALTIPENYIRTFSANWEHTVQQELKKLADKVTVDPFEGKEKIYTDIEPVTFTQRVGRLTKSNPKEIGSAKRKATKSEFKCQIIFDRSDATFLAMLGEPDSELMQEMKIAWNKSCDDGFITAATATVYGGADPFVTAITLPSTQTVAVDFVTVGSQTNTGLTPDKLQRAIKLFEDNNLDVMAEDFMLAISPKQKEDLFQYVKSAPNAPYAQMIGAWLNNPSTKLFGFTVIISTRLSINTSTDVRTCLAWSKRGIYAAPDKMEVKVDLRADLDHAKQISAYGDYSFMRRREERVVKILCDESP